MPVRNSTPIRTNSYYTHRTVFFMHVSSVHEYQNLHELLCTDNDTWRGNSGLRKPQISDPRLALPADKSQREWSSCYQQNICNSEFRSLLTVKMTNSVSETLQNKAKFPCAWIAGIRMRKWFWCHYSFFPAASLKVGLELPSILLTKHEHITRLIFSSQQWQPAVCT